MATYTTFARFAHCSYEFSKASITFSKKMGLANVLILASIMKWHFRACCKFCEHLIKCLASIPSLASLTISDCTAHIRFRTVCLQYANERRGMNVRSIVLPIFYSGKIVSFKRKGEKENCVVDNKIIISERPKKEDQNIKKHFSFKHLSL